MTEQEHYERIDLPFYRGEIKPILSQSLAIRRAAERVRLSEEKLKAIFHDNGLGLLKRVQRPEA
jgi:hypothetical protein